MIDNELAWRWQMLALTAVIALVLWLLAPVLTPFALAAMLAYLGDPLADRLEKLRLNRTLSVSIVFAAMLLVVIGALLLLVPLIERQIARLIRSLPDYALWFQQQAAPWLKQRFDLDVGAFDMNGIVNLLKQHIGSAGGVAAMVLTQVSKSGLALVAWLANLLLVPVVTFYLLRDWDVLVGRVHDLLPRSLEPVVSRLAGESDTVLGAFVRGQLLVMLALGLVYGVGLWLIGLDVGPLIGMIAGLVSFVPYLGFIVGLISSLIAALVQFHDWQHLVMVLVVFGIGQTLEGYVLVPRLVGDKIGLHPVAVIFAVLAGGQLFGFLGVLLALPVASIIMVLLRYAHQRYLDSYLYRNGEQVTLAADAPEAAEDIADAATTAAVPVAEQPATAASKRADSDAAH
ncbi:MAG TPA: AI-2E family transporter [Rhodanobacteraceae bacterium]|nr:AI-2E family transporter [Rhodanobacteraceae bacterium]